MNPQTLLKQAVAFHQKGNLADAEPLYRQVLSADPASFHANHLLGVLRSQQGRPDEALELIGAALKANAASVPALVNYANALKQTGRPDDALRTYDQALALKPDALIFFNRGALLQEMGRLDEALESYDRALAANPSYFEALNNRANILKHDKRLEEALADFDLALAIRPGDPEILNNRGGVFRDLQKFDDALASFSQAIASKPQHAGALYNRGVLLWAERRDYAAALRDLEQAVAIDPNADYALGDLLHLKLQGGDWRGFEAAVARIDAGVRAGKAVATPFKYQGISHSPEDLQRCAVIHARHRYPAAAPLWPGRARRHGKIRIGYVCGEFGDHATVHLTAGLFEEHDRGRFEILAIDNGVADGSASRARVEKSFDRVLDISRLPDDQAAAAILAGEIDILVNLNGYYGLSRMGVFARKPAPVQVNYLGFPGTLGADYIDYLIADRIVIPGNEECFYAEKIVTLPDSYQVNDARRCIAPKRFDRTACGLPEQGFVFCNFNQAYKLTPESFSAWMRILDQVPGSILWLLESTPEFRENLRQEAQARGVAGERLVFAPFIAAEEHLARLRLADLCLDTLPYNAHTTASDALWAGVPLITCTGHSFAGRVATSLLQAIGLPELVCADMDSFEALAVTLARDAALLKSLREKLAHNRGTTALFDTARFTRNIEAAYTQMWDAWRRGDAPRGFAVG